MTDDLRHYCRNPRCRSKLKEPISNLREAFCARGYHTQFYRRRCSVCEQPMERKTENQRLCGKRKCSNAFEALKAHLQLGRYFSPASGGAPLENPYFTGIKSPLTSGRPWRIVAGAPITDRTLHLATLGAADIDRKLNVRHWREAGANAVFQRDTAPLNITGGYRWPNAPRLGADQSAPPAHIEAAEASA